MPIRTIQRRHAELGRIRLGEKKQTSNGKSYPSKLSQFRFTSPNQRHVQALAELYGGTVRQWDNNGRAEWEVITTTQAIPVVVVRGGLSQWLETWTGGGCVHRCDGYNNVLTGEPCDENDPQHINAKPTTRLSVMLPQLEAIGVWRLESHGWNAAAELPGVSELAQMVGELVPATLVLHERVAIKDGKTSRFVVPGLDLHVTTGRLVEIANATAAGQPVPAQIGGTTPAQIEGRGMDADDWTDAVADATSKDELRDIWNRADRAGALTGDLKQRITGAVADLEAATPPEYSEPIEAADGGDVDTAWMQLQVAAGQIGIGDSNLRALLEQEYAQPVEDLSAQELLAFIPKLGDAA